MKMQKEDNKGQLVVKVGWVVLSRQHIDDGGLGRLPHQQVYWMGYIVHAMAGQ